ncbi:hypothetical protein CHU_0209 [Cytophaga hutchinsonii ATCC 33406]|uniref:Uncharacterized protein n=1 Tax=Cytophaga hutchinsonii (strain ATCC 33406 / DSM 1761 / CIP 103989 / NBRC 15051 / NCIMB 9469 / D465) TaxID=269798 RepID=A0A6N4SMK1_CYTH3|nr:hypothetical protein CHU_0209 [Cytophaga hutchinsonii ATCC 33406]
MRLAQMLRAPLTSKGQRTLLYLTNRKPYRDVFFRFLNLCFSYTLFFLQKFVGNTLDKLKI